MLVDTNVLVDVLENDPDWAAWSVAQLRAQAQIHRLVINPVIYAELSLTFSSLEALDDTLADLQIPVIDIPKPALFLAGKAFAKYRAPDDTPGLRLSDFFIGAHAAVAGVPVLTRDARKLAWYFPTVAWLAPTQTSP
jgi:predicted nucleic acid-binding protein